MFGKKRKLFGNNISPACEYCRFGSPSSDSTMILCDKKGVVSPYYYCNKFSYMPTKRIPKRPPEIPQFSKDDFKL